MEAYTSFAQVYDLFMDNVPYEEWADYIEARLKENGIDAGTVLDLGCGTGKITRLMAAKGYDMIGIDNAMDMLDIAMNYSLDYEEVEATTEPEEDEAADFSILYLLQDMRELDLGESVDAIYSACDCLNYILDEEDLLLCFKRAYEHLEKNGIFIFDMNTKYKYEELLAENTFAENREEGSFIWENYYDEEDQINQYDLTLYISETIADLETSEDVEFSKSYLRFEETHYQRAYSTELILELVKKAGFEILGVYEGYSLETLKDDSDRVSVVCRK